MTDATITAVIALPATVAAAFLAMTDTTIITGLAMLLAAIPTTIAALGMKAAQEARTKAEIASEVAKAGLEQSIKNGKKTDAVVTMTDRIHELTNSNLSEAVKSLAVATQTIEGLNKLIALLESEKADKHRVQDVIVKNETAIPVHQTQPVKVI